MKKLLMAAAASTALMASPAFAQSATESDSFTINANIQQECSIDDPDNVNFGNLAIIEGSGPNALLLNGDDDDDQDVWVSCNYAASVRMTSANGGLTNPAGATLVANDPSDFTNTIEYRLTLDDGAGSELGGSHTLLTTAGGAGVTTSWARPGAFHLNADLEVRIDDADNPRRPVAGSYSDTATITVGVV